VPQGLFALIVATCSLAGRMSATTLRGSGDFRAAVIRRSMYLSRAVRLMLKSGAVSVPVIRFIRSTQM